MLFGLFNKPSKGQMKSDLYKFQEEIITQKIKLQKKYHLFGLLISIHPKGEHLCELVISTCSPDLL